MRNYEKPYYKEFLDYNGYETILTGGKIDNTNYTQLDKIKSIFNTDNDNFIWIFIWSQWIEKAGTCYLWNHSDKNGWEKNKTLSNFKDFNLNPYDSSKKRVIPIVDISDFITIMNQGSTTNSSIFQNKILTINYKDYLKKLKNFDFYVDTKYDDIKDSLSGTFFDIINTLGYSPDEFYAKQSYIKSQSSSSKNKEGKTVNTTKSVPIGISYATIDKEELNLISKAYDKLTKYSIFIDSSKPVSDMDMNEQRVLISDLGGRIFRIIQSYLDMYCNVYNIYQSENVKEPQEPPQINFNEFNIKREDAGSLPIEQTLMLSRPEIEPSFKKSYIVRENNLKPFVNIRLEYQVGLKSDESIDVNYFSIPYNSILSLEHNVKEFNMTLNLIDTQGNLSELLIQKIYALSQKKANALVEKNFNPLGEYRFFIEYGWSGPDTDSADELMEEQVYVKTIHRGYLKSISSQYSFKGTEYTLNIIPNDFTHFNSGFNDTSSLYFNKGTTNAFLTPVVGLLVLYLLLAKPADKLADIINTAVPEKISFLEKLFLFLEKIDINRGAGKGINTHYWLTYEKQNLHSGKSPEWGLYHNINGGYAKDTDMLATYLFANKGKNDASSKKLSQIKYNNEALENIKNICDLTSISLNAWLVGIYLIWSIKRANEDKFILCDTTGLFDVFNKSSAMKIASMKSNEDILEIIKKFNPYALKKDKLAVAKDKLFDYIKEKNNFNGYDLSQILNLEPEPNDTSRDLTFMIQQLNGVFTEIKNIGMNADVDNNNIYHGADGIILNYDIYRTGLDNQNDFLFEYKKKIFTDKNNIYYDGDDTKVQESEKRHNKKYIEFQDKVKGFFLGGYEIPVFYLSYITNANKVAFLNCSLSKKISLLGKQLVQSYSFTPRIYPKTRNQNKQFFSQGNANILKEGSGDIIEFSIDPVDIGNFNSIMLANKNKSNVGFDNVSSNAFVGGIYQNAAQYYKTYRSIDGQENITKITQDMAKLDLNYQSQTAIKGSITIIGEPYWSNVNLLMAKAIYINVYYANGNRSSHSGIYYVAGVIQNVSEGKFTTRIEIIRAPTFLSALEKIVNKNKYIG